MSESTGGGGGTSQFRATTTGGNISKLAESADGVDPFIQVSYKVPGGSGTTITETTTVSGTTTDTLTIKCDVVKSQTVSVTVDGSSIPSNPTSVTSDTANFYSISQSNLQLSELILEITDDEDSSVVTTSTTNLFQTPLTVFPSVAQNYRNFIVYATEDIPVRITLDGACGKGRGSFNGGLGGRTVFDYTLLANTEYVFKLSRVIDNVSGGPGSFFYEKGTLLVVSGGGGSAGDGGNGGNGGAAGIRGSAGGGSNSGSGGSGFLNGTLPSNGVLPSGRTGGRVEPCTTGYYWQTQGKSPCEDLGKVQFFTANGDASSGSTSSITRGFKSDLPYSNGNYGFRFNGGSSTFGRGGGGSGATGGDATSDGQGGGGGGSGYSNGSVTIVSTGTVTNVNTAGDPSPGLVKIELRT